MADTKTGPGRNDRDADSVGGSITGARPGIGDQRSRVGHRIPRDAALGCRAMQPSSGADIVGVKKLIFLHQANEGVESTGELVQRIMELVATTRPDVVYLPFFLERHPDHVATNRALMLAYLQTPPMVEFYCCAYETVDPMPRPNCVIDIGDSVSKKAQALGAHVTAVRSMNTVDPTLGLNMHRALHIPGGKGYAEAFVYTPAAEYFRLIQATFANA